MDYTYNYHQTFLKENKDSESTAETLGTKNPYTVFLNEVLIEYLRELAIFIIKLKKLGITNEKIKEDIIEATSIGISNVEYNEEHFFALITKLYSEMLNAKELYINVCKRNNLKFILPKSSVKHPQKLSFTDLIKRGQKNFNLKYTNLDVDQMSLIELYMNIIRSLCVSLVELRMLGFDDAEVYDELLLTFALKSTYMPYIQKVLPNKIKDLVNVNNKIVRKLYEAKKEKYGDIEPTEVSTTTIPGKAILVSGSNLKELELLLEATADKNINVYTHGHMIAAHLYPKFKAYPHLVGHFGKDLSNYIMDFSEFPGAIFFTRHSFLNAEKLLQCKIFTTDPISTTGIDLIKNNHYEPIIEASLHAEGFEETTQHEGIKFNWSEKFFIEKISETARKIETGEIKHFFAIGVSNHTQTQEEYFQKFLDLLDDSCFALSFSYFKDTKNILHIQAGYGFPLVYDALDILTKNISIEQLDPIILFTRCETHTFANALYVKQLGINKVYFTDCSPALINPALTKFVRKTFDIKDYSTPEGDLKEMLS
jgi:hydroxylamine reductase